jgi:hypothetical protein
VHSLSRLCTSIHPLRLLSAFIPSVHHVHLDPSIAPLYLLRYSTADPLNSLSTFRAKPPIVQVGHYGQPTVTTTIQNCWHKAGILPEAEAFSSHISEPTIPISALLHDSDIQTDPIAYVERQVELALDKLVLRGTLQKGNRMDIGSLLNLAGESHVLTEASDSDIYQAVTEAFEACENLEINGGDDVDEDGPVKPRPARSAILQASSMISDYLATENDPFAQEFEELLGTFSRRLHLDAAKSMKNTVLTDFFRTHNTTDLE